MNQRKAGVILSYFTLGFNIIIGLFFTPFLIQKIGDSQYGIFSLAHSLISLVTLLDLGFGQTIVRYISKARTTGDIEEEYRLNGFFLKIYIAIACVALVIGFCIVLIYPNMAKKSIALEDINLFRIVFSILLINVAISFPMSVFSATLTAYEEFTFLKAVNLIATILKYLSMFLILEIGYRLIGITIISFITSMCIQGLNMFYSISKLKMRFDFSKIKTSIKRDVIHFSFFIFLNLIIDFLYSNTDKLILGVVAGTVSVSVYSIGIYFTTYFTELSTAMSGVFMPKIMRLYQDSDMKGISDLFNKVGRLQMALLFLVLGGYICFGKEFINLWVGTTYRDSYYIGLIIMLPSLIPLTQNIGITIIRAMNIHKYRSYMYVVIAIINVIISIPLAQMYGGIGAAIGTCLATFAGQIFFMNWFYSVKVHIDIKEYWKNFIGFSMITIVEIMLFQFMKSFVVIHSWVSLITNILIFILAYFILYFACIANQYEKEIVFKLVHRG